MGTVLSRKRDRGSFSPLWEEIEYSCLAARRRSHKSWPCWHHDLHLRGLCDITALVATAWPELTEAVGNICLKKERLFAPGRMFLISYL